MVCEITVAQAAPLMPHPHEKMKMGFNTQFTTTESSVVYIAMRGNPDERSTALRPKYMWVIMLP